MLFALILFIVLLIAGKVKEELSWGGILMCLVIASGSLAAFPAFQWEPHLYTVVLALLDVVLILVVFKGDVRLR